VGASVVVLGPGRMGLALASALLDTEAATEVTVFGRRPAPPSHPLFMQDRTRYVFGVEPLPGPTDTDLLFTIIRSRDHIIAERIEGFRANAIMMRNISFGLFLIGLVELSKFFINNYVVDFLGIAILSFIFSGIALRGAFRFYKWFYRDIIRISAVYGSTYLEVVKKFQKEVTAKKD
jgi:hypothetical protein